MCFYNDDYDGEIMSDGVSTARKAHKCCECRGAINPGDRFEWFSCRDDGSFSTLRLCRRCCYDRNRVVEHEIAEGCHWADSWPPIGGGAIAEYLEQSGLGQTAPEDVPESFVVGDQPKQPATA